ncbi:hypothetical protein J4434_03030 [Candidatus Woesearchaeota archaeon]|nr:hypothetical protein [Candidatus Woesearchaeota archaeon]
MAKENFNSWLEEKVEELRKTPQRNVVPIPNPRAAMRQFEDEVMSGYLSLKRKAIRKVVHPFKDYNLEYGVKEEAGKIQRVLYDAVNEVYSRMKRITAVEQKIDSLSVERAYLLSYHGQLEQLAGMLPRIITMTKQDKQLSEQDEEEQVDGNNADEKNKKGKEDEKENITAPNVKTVSYNLGHIVAASSLDEQAEYVSKEITRVDALIKDYTERIDSEKGKLKGLGGMEEELRTYLQDTQERISVNMLILRKIELFKEFAERYATKDTNPFIIERLNQLLMPYTQVMQEIEVNVNDMRMKLAGSFIAAKMLQERNSGEPAYMSNGIIGYFKEMSKIIVN